MPSEGDQPMTSKNDNGAIRFDLPRMDHLKH
jgi:hypothetical protein